MFMHPHIGQQLADEHRRDLLAEAQQRRLVRQLHAEPETALRRQPVAYRLWRRLRPASGPHLEPQE